MTTMSTRFLSPFPMIALATALLSSTAHAQAPDIEPTALAAIAPSDATASESGAVYLQLAHQLTPTTLADTASQKQLLEARTHAQEWARIR